MPPAIPATQPINLSSSKRPPNWPIWHNRPMKEGYILELENGNKIDNTDESSKQRFLRLLFALSADIDLNGYEWTPIGNDTHPFKGHFNGDGHVVRGLKMNVEIETKTTTYAGLFGYIENGTLRNLGVWLAPEGDRGFFNTIWLYLCRRIGRICDGNRLKDPRQYPKLLCGRRG